MINTAYAMAQQQGAEGQGGSPLFSLLPLILIFLVFYFLLIRPQKKQMQKHKEMVSSLKKGDKIVTSGGIHGKITAIKGKEVEVEIAPQTRILINKQSVSQVKNVESSAEKA